MIQWMWIQPTVSDENKCSASSFLLIVLFLCRRFPAAWAATAGDPVPLPADVANPWESAPAAASDDQEDNWANFSKADFDSLASTTPMEVTDSPSTAGK